MKEQFINSSNIVDAVVLEPCDGGDYSEPHKWLLCLTTNTTIEGFPYIIKKEYASESECLNIINSLGLVRI